MSVCADTHILEEGYVAVTLGSAGCDEERELRYRLEIRGERGVILVERLVATTVPEFTPFEKKISRDDLDSSARALRSLFLRKETPYGTSCTTRHYARMQWGLGDDTGSRECETTEQQDMDFDWLLSILGDGETGDETRARIAVIKRKGYHNWTHALFDTSNSLLRRFIPKELPLWNAFFGAPPRLSILQRDEESDGSR